MNDKAHRPDTGNGVNALTIRRSRVHRLLRSWPWLACLLAILLWGGSALAQTKLEDFEVHPGLDIGGDFTLTGPDGQAVNLEEFRGKVVILSFGYTHCPDACPITLSKFLQVSNALKEQRSGMQAILITLDPERDTPEVLKEYVAHFDPSFLGLTGDTESIAAVAGRYLAKFRRREVDSPVEYLVDHTTLTYVIDKSGKVRYLFNLDTPPTIIAEGVKVLLRKASI